MSLAYEVALLRQEGQFRQAEAREDSQGGVEAMRIPQAPTQLRSPQGSVLSGQGGTDGTARTFPLAFPLLGSGSSASEATPRPPPRPVLHLVKPFTGFLFISGTWHAPELLISQVCFLTRKSLIRSKHTWRGPGCRVLSPKEVSSWGLFTWSVFDHQPRDTGNLCKRTEKQNKNLL